MTTTINICHPHLFSWAESLWYLNRGFDDCIYKISGNTVRRAFDVEGEKILTEISCTDGTLMINWLTGKPSDRTEAYISSFVGVWFDLDTDLTPFYKLLAGHPAVADMTASYHGLRLVAMPDLFETLSWAIIGQQINLTFAYKLKRRLVEQYGSTLTFEGQTYHIFPKPGALKNASVVDLRELQLSGSKASYLVNIAESFADNRLSREILLALPDFPPRQKYLTDIKGIGIWTANYVLMKNLGERACIPYGDAGLLNALVARNIIADKRDKAGLDAFFELFKGWEAYMVFYLWRSLA
ncbi:DNA-3-methyladenine glycosylase [Mucilaginibacter sp. L3T2-6]|uniref:DNA-3-methyladenine glycosylase family protein n=1 Tax=Mucilaginibacter sp. L3T2-6 TaxID=3062491 RepID=UPI002676F6A6|nr:DNA glycosylase [Mucilaginibacter sp. L3T2-6]MDO3641437.1 DNA glycosylase [Mucilaginibacter sp. L3T2-6]MDV6213802.1 DNA glycosylase [Mucilaginibacter sp. L3T2-6]